MPYTVLYRKKRPRTFSAIVGQPHIVEALRNQLRSGQTSHAYLFCGTRGTGKTTAAKIMARAINCTDLQDGNPCNVCEMCESILADRCLDVAEIDAASNNGVDDIRNLREEVKYPPTTGQYKVYIIDEVHMLSTSAFNALLKTLEEPPPFVVFILATTDPQKVPVTVLSRCQRYDFRRINAPDIVATLGKYLGEENCGFEPAALDFIAYHCDGAMRDALSLLDQALSLRAAVDAPLTLAAVRDLLGAVDRRVLFDFTDALARGDGATALALIDQAANDGRDVGQLASDLVRHFRDALVAALVGSTNGLDVAAEVAAQLKTQGQAVGADALMGYVRVFSELLRELRFAPHKRTALEVCALAVCNPVAAVADVVPVAVAASVEVAVPKTVAPPVEAVAPPPAVSAGSASALQDIPADWASICRGLAQPLQSMLARCTVAAQGEQLLITGDSEAGINLIKSHQMVIREALADRYNLDTPPNLLFTVGTAKPTPKPLPPAAKPPAVKPPAPPAFTQMEADAPFPDPPPPDDSDDWGSIGQLEIGGDVPF